MRYATAILTSLTLIAGLNSVPALAHGNAVVGGLIGGAAGAAIGNSINGRDGAIVGAALGGATGVAIATQSHYREIPRYVERERIVVRDEPRYVYVQPREERIVYAPRPVYWREVHRWHHRDWDRDDRWDDHRDWERHRPHDRRWDD